jgi:broad specificity phosphatase PhoE
VSQELYLVRHGLCDSGGTLLGQCDVELTAEGRAQARALGEQLADAGAERLVSSDLRRAWQTAEILAERLGLPAEADARLREVSYGDWDGLTWDEIERLDPEGARRKVADWTGWTPPGGETWETFQERVEDLRAALSAAAARTTIVVAHRAVNAVLAGLPPDGFEQDYGTFRCVTIL